MNNVLSNYYKKNANIFMYKRFKKIKLNWSFSSLVLQWHPLETWYAIGTASQLICIEHRKKYQFNYMLKLSSQEISLICHVARYHFTKVLQWTFRLALFNTCKSRVMQASSEQLLITKLLVRYAQPQGCYIQSLLLFYFWYCKSEISPQLMIS